MKTSIFASFRATKYPCFVNKSKDKLPKGGKRVEILGTRTGKVKKKHPLEVLFLEAIFQSNQRLNSINLKWPKYRAFSGIYRLTKEVGLPLNIGGTVSLAVTTCSVGRILCALERMRKCNRVKLGLI
jgi:hypothetical protein